MDGQRFGQKGLRFAVLLLGLILQVWNNPSTADERVWYRAGEALLMGGAYTDYGQEMPVLHNPALLGRSYEATVSFLEGQLSVTNLLEDESLNRFEDLPHDAFAIEERLQGFPLHIQLGYSPGIRLGPFEFRYFATSEHQHILLNKVSPMLKLNYHYDQGVVAGFAYGWGKKNFVHTRARTTGEDGHHFNIGAAVKIVHRETLLNDYALYSPTILNLIKEEDKRDYEDYVEALGARKGKGLGVDVGFDYTYRWENSIFGAGFTIEDIGGTSFKPLEEDLNIPLQAMKANAGIMWQQNIDELELVLTADMHDLQRRAPWQQKLRYGIKFGIPYFHVFGGRYDNCSSYGLQAKLWPIEVLLGSYQVNLGPVNTERPMRTRRLVFYINLFELDLDL